MSLACLVCCALPVRFVARPFSASPHPPGHAGEGVAEQREEGDEKGKGSSQGHGNSTKKRASHCEYACPPIPDHHPVGAPESKRTGQGQHWAGNIGTLGLGTLWRRHTGQGDRRGSGLDRAPEKDTWRKRRSESTYLHIRPAQPNPIQAVPRSFLSTSTFPVELELVLELAPHLTEE